MSKEYVQHEAMKVIEPAIDKGASRNLANTLRVNRAYCLKPNILGLKKLGAVDFLINKCKVPIIFLEDIKELIKERLLK